MKKLIACLLAVVTLLLALCACGEPSAPTSGDVSGQSSGATSTSEKTSGSSSEASGYATLPVGTVRLTNVGTGKKLTYEVGKEPTLAIAKQNEQSAISLNFVNYKGDRVYLFEFACIQQKAHNDNKKLVYDNVEVNENALTVKAFKDGTVEIKQRDKSNAQLWYAVANADGSYTFLCRSNRGFALAMEGDDLCIKEDTTSDSVKWTLENISTSNDFYKEYVSAEGNAAVRVPLDVLEKSKIKEDRLVQYASDISELMHVYDEMTQFHPHDTIFIHAYNYQGVMAGVIGTDQVYVNCGPGEWYYSDLDKMQERWDKGQHDISWMAMHEIGHLYDMNRDWNFEGECMTDIKVILALLVKEDEGWVAAPAEYPASQVFGYTKNKEKKVGSAAECCYGLGGSSMRKSYSIYHLAGVFADISYKIGYEPFAKTYNWFQNEMKASEKPQNRVERFDLFLAKLSEYSGKDVKGMIKDVEYNVCVEEFGKD